MISIYQLKSRFQGLLRPWVVKLAAKGVTANQITIAAVLLSAFGGVCIAAFPQSRVPFLLLPPILLVRMALNAIDGMLAREHDMKSNLGTFLNELGDVVSDSVLYLPFMLVPDIAGWIIVWICLLAIISEMTGVVAIQIGATRRYDGPMGKSDRAFVFGFVAFLLGLGITPGKWINRLFFIVLLLLAMTIYNRAKNALKAPHA